MVERFFLLVFPKTRMVERFLLVFFSKTRMVGWTIERVGATTVPVLSVGRGARSGVNRDRGNRPESPCRRFVTLLPFVRYPS